MQVNNIDNEIISDNIKKASIVFTKIKIIRNLKKYFFENVLGNDKKRKLEKEIVNFILNWKSNISVFDLNEIKNDEKKIYLDENLIEKQFYQKNDGKFIVFPDKNISLVLNNNDHINISIVNSNLDLMDSYKTIEKIEDRIGDKFSYAALKKYGFLTSQVKNCGLGLKIYILLYLPGIGLLEKDKETFDLYKNYGYSIVPWGYVKDNTHYFVVSSRLNFGVSENDLLSRFSKGIEDLIKINYQYLQEYVSRNEDEFVDKIHRSYGTLKYVKKIDYIEALNLLSNIRTGLLLNEKIPVSVEILNKLFTKIKDGNVDKFAKENNLDKNVALAKIITCYLNGEY